MPKSKHRKKHKAKLQKRRNKINNAKRQYNNIKTTQLENMIKQIQAQQAESNNEEE